MKTKKLFIFLIFLICFSFFIVSCAPDEEIDLDEEEVLEVDPDLDPIIFAVPTALGSIEGRDCLRAVELAAHEINEAGGIQVGDEKRPIQVVSADTREHEPGIPVHDALAANERLIDVHNPDAIIVGAFRSEVLLAAMDMISDHGIPYITNIAMTPEFERKIAEDPEKYKYFFRTCLNAVYLAEYIVSLTEFVGEAHGFNRAQLLVQDVLWATATGGIVQDRLEDSGWEVVDLTPYPTGADDYSASLAKARDEGTEILIPIFDMPPSGVLVRQAREMEIPALVSGFISPAAPMNAWDVFDGQLGGLINLVFEVGNVPVEAIPASMHFFEAYKEFHGEDAVASLSGHGPGPAYDSVYIMAEAIERAGTTDGDAVAEALKDTDYEGVIGRVRFNENHQAVFGYDPEETALGMAFQWREPGERVAVFPELVAEDTIQLPGYME